MVVRNEINKQCSEREPKVKLTWKYVSIPSSSLIVNTGNLLERLQWYKQVAFLLKVNSGQAINAGHGSNAHML